MADNNQNQAQAAADAPAKIANAVAEVTEKAVTETKRVQKSERAKTARRAKRQATAAKASKRTASRRADKAARTTRNAARSTARAAQQGIQNMTNYDFFKGFDALPGFNPFQDMLNKANENGRQFASKGQKVAEELADLARANVEAMVEAGRVASEGAKALGQDAVSTGREGFEKAADAIRTLAEAKSPTEYLQLQGEFARASFDRMVAEGSKLTETMVKLAGEAFQPIQNRAAANAERFNTFVA